ncbi:MAG: 50S ribosome-binding GTPase [Comamonadaceae bacterium]|nr:50S ribosome-binding GTPase [Comamonadaceae bacterium]
MIGERIKSREGAAGEGQAASAARSAGRASAAARFRVSLVGYTNAGKSTLFNALVKARAYAADQLFATLDTTTRLAVARRRPGARCRCPTPWASSATCRTSWSRPSSATLQEAADADLLLHVVDAASPLAAEQIAEVERVLAEIGADRHPADPGASTSCDLLEAAARPRALVDCDRARPAACARRACSSARATAHGLDVLRQLIADMRCGA